MLKTVNPALAKTWLNTTSDTAINWLGDRVAIIPGLSSSKNPSNSGYPFKTTVY